MDPACIEFALTNPERAAFECDGFLVLENVMPTAQVALLTDAVDHLAAAQRRDGLGAGERVDVRDLLWRDPLFLNLVDWPTTFPKVWGILGWNIQIYHTLYMEAPPEVPASSPVRSLGWHRDTGQLNRDLEIHPRISVKVAFFLSDCSAAGSANFWAVPGSHLQDQLERPADGSLPAAATPGGRGGVSPLRLNYLPVALHQLGHTCIV